MSNVKQDILTFCYALFIAVTSICSPVFLPAPYGLLLGLFFGLGGILFGVMVIVPYFLKNG